MNDNLPVNENAVDGNVKMDSKEMLHTENQEVEANTKTVKPVVELVPDTEVEAPLVAELEQEKVLEVEDLVGEEIEESHIETTPEEIAETKELVVEEVPETVEEEIIDVPVATSKLDNSNEHKKKEENISIAEEESNIAVNAIADVKGRHDIPLQDYEALPMDKLVEELETLVAVEQVMSVREHVE